MEDYQPKRNLKALMPVFFALTLIAGVLIGYRLNFSKEYPMARTGGGGKLEGVLNYITAQYVDTINKDDLEDKTLTAMLHSLDPHSDYIPASDLEMSDEPLKGNFDGIGVEFNIFDDTITVVSPIEGGPSEKAGILAGDKFITVNKEKVAGVKITNKQVFDKLRGERGTKVVIEIKRAGEPKLIPFTIKRDEIPLHSLDAAYIIPNTNIGYIKISRFAAPTFDEYKQARSKLTKQGMKKLIVDLRGNGGGYLNTAVDLADEFLSKGMQIVYTKGKASPKKSYMATEQGAFENNPLCVLIDENSASASEILAGCLQDNDRATIVGRRSFGKGLVQDQIPFSDGSAMRLTIARYYTPSGRCIQKPYTNGNDEYYNEELTRYSSGELYNADSIKFADSLKYKTVSGKTVYGGGGIMPDVFVPLDTSYRSVYLSKISYSGLINQYAFDYTDKNRKALKYYKDATSYINTFVVSNEMINAFYAYAEKNKISRNTADIAKSGEYIKLQIKALIGRNLFGNDAYYPILHLNDNTLKKAVDLMKK